MSESERRSGKSKAVESVREYFRAGEILIFPELKKLVNQGLGSLDLKLMVCVM